MDHHGAAGAGHGEQAEARAVGHAVGHDQGDVGARDHDQYDAGEHEGEVEVERHGGCLHRNERRRHAPPPSGMGEHRPEINLWVAISLKLLYLVSLFRGCVAAHACSTAWPRRGQQGVPPSPLSCARTKESDMARAKAATRKRVAVREIRVAVGNVRFDDIVRSCARPGRSPASAAAIPAGRASTSSSSRTSRSASADRRAWANATSGSPSSVRTSASAGGISRAFSRSASASPTRPSCATTSGRGATGSDFLEVVPDILWTDLGPAPAHATATSRRTWRSFATWHAPCR